MDGRGRKDGKRKRTEMLSFSDRQSSTLMVSGLSGARTAKRDFPPNTRVTGDSTKLACSYPCIRQDIQAQRRETDEIISAPSGLTETPRALPPQMQQRPACVTQATLHEERRGRERKTLLHPAVYYPMYIRPTQISNSRALVSGSATYQQFFELPLPSFHRIIHVCRLKWIHSIALFLRFFVFSWLSNCRLLGRGRLLLEPEFLKESYRGIHHWCRATTSLRTPFSGLTP